MLASLRRSLPASANSQIPNLLKSCARNEQSVTRTMLQRGQGKGAGGCRSLSVSSHSDAPEEPLVLKEANHAAAVASLQRVRRGYKYGRRRSKRTSFPASSGTSTRVRALRSTLKGGLASIRSRDHYKGTGSFERLVLLSSASASQSGRLCFVIKPKVFTSNVSGLRPRKPVKTGSRWPVAVAPADEEETTLNLKAASARGTQALNSANRNIALMKKEWLAVRKKQNETFDAVDMEIRKLHLELYELKQSFRKRCMGILNSLAGSTWTIDNGGKPAKGAKAIPPSASHVLQRAKGCTKNGVKNKNSRLRNSSKSAV